MGKAAPLIAALIVGTALAVQGAINSELSRHVGQIRAVMISVLGTMITVLIVLLVSSPAGSFSGLAQAPRWSLVGGVFGVLSLLGTIIAIPRIGVVATTAAIIAAQLAASAVLDQFGLLGVAARHVTPARLGGILLLALAVFIIARSG